MSRRTDIVREYFESVDDGNFPTKLFTSDFEFYFYKFGRGIGEADFEEFRSGMMGGARAGLSSRHVLEDFTYHEAPNAVTAEGSTETRMDGEVISTVGLTSGARFCSVFVFEADDRISRMYIYRDPDVMGQDKERFRWPARQSQW